jgi:hypothetical protein
VQSAQLFPASAAGIVGDKNPNVGFTKKIDSRIETHQNECAEDEGKRQKSWNNLLRSQNIRPFLAIQHLTPAV